MTTSEMCNSIQFVNPNLSRKTLESVLHCDTAGMSSSVLSAGLIPCCPSPLIFVTLLLGSRESPTSQDINYFQFNILSQVYIYNRTTYSSATVLKQALSEAPRFSRFKKM